MKKFFAIAAVVVSLLGLTATTSEARCHGGYGYGGCYNDGYNGGCYNDGYHCYDGNGCYDSYRR